MAETQHDKSAFDTDRQYLGSVYAKALLGSAEAAGETEAVLDELESFITDVLDKLPNLEAVLYSPRVPHAAKVEMLERSFGGKMKPLLLNFLKVVSDHGRMDCVRAMSRLARQMFNEQRGHVEVRLQTASAVDGNLLAFITDRLRSVLGGEVDLKTDVDPELIGGAVVRVGDTVFDGSVSNQLARMREVAVSQTAQRIRSAVEQFASDE